MIRVVMLLAGVGVAAIVLGVAALAGSDTSSAAACGPSSGGPVNVAGVPSRDLQYFEGAAELFGLGSNGWMYLAGINADESSFGTSLLPGVRSGTNSAGAAGPMQIGVGGAATDNWDAVVGEIPTGLAGGAEPAPSVYNEADAVYGAAALLSHWGAPLDWLGALRIWNAFPPEIATVEAWVAKLTGQTTSGARGAPAPRPGAVSVPAAGPVGSTSTASANESPTTSGSPRSGAGTCLAVSGPSVPGAAASVQKSGLATIPDGAPPEVQAMLAAGNQIIDYPYSWGGAHSSRAMVIPPGPSVDPGEEENGGPGFDCSSAVSFVMWNAGLGVSLMRHTVFTSGEFETAGLAGPGNWVTIYAGTSGGVGHVFVEVDGVVLDTVQSTQTFPVGSGPRWEPISDVPFELSSGQFVARHPAGL